MLKRDSWNFKNLSWEHLKPKTYPTLEYLGRNPLCTGLKLIVSNTFRRRQRRFLVDVFLTSYVRLFEVLCPDGYYFEIYFHYYVMLCAISCHMYNLKSVKNIHGQMLLLVKLQAEACNYTKSSTPPWLFFTFFKLYKKCQIVEKVPNCVEHHIWLTIQLEGAHV